MGSIDITQQVVAIKSGRDVIPWRLKNIGRVINTCRNGYDKVYQQGGSKKCK